jgi:hypothetical protein
MPFLGGCKFGSSSHPGKRPRAFSERRSEEVAAAGEALTLRANKARPPTALVSHKFMKGNGMIRATHLPHSPDIASSDSYLFRYIEHCLRGQSFETAHELFVSIEAVVRVFRFFSSR